MYNLHITQPSKSLIAILQRFTVIVLFFIVFADNATAVDETSAYENMIFRLRENDKCYYVNINGDKITNQFYEYNYRNAKHYEKGFGYIAVVRDGLSGLIDSYGREILPCRYQDIEYCEQDISETIFQVESDGKYALFNPNKGFITSFEYDNIWLWFPNDTKIVPCRKNGKWGFINYSTGKVVTPFIYTDLDCFRDENSYILQCGLLCASKGEGMWGIVSSSGKEITPFSHNYAKGDFASLIYYLPEGQVLLQNSENKEWFKYSVNGGKRVKIGNYDHIDLPVNGMAVVNKGDRYGILNLLNNKLVFPCEHINKGDFYSPFFIHHNFISMIKNSNKVIITDQTGKIITNSIFRFVHWGDKRIEKHLGEMGLFCSKDDVIGKMGAIDIKGKIVVPFIYDTLFPFHENGLAIYMDNERCGVIDKNNHVKIPAEYDLLSERYTNGDLTLFLAKKNEKFGLLSSSNKIIIPIEYDHIDDFDKNGFARFKKGNQYGYVNIDGEIISSSYDSDKNELLCYQYLFKRQPSDVDKNIPANSLLNDRTFAVIIANEEYSESGISKVNYAHNDGEIFKKYCEQALGIPSSNIRFVKDATFNQIRSSVNWISDRAKVFDGEAELLIYYSGHGIPDEKDGKAYLMPSDGIANDTRSYYSLAELYDQIGALPSKKSVILLDACFSGTSKEGNMMLANTKGIALKHEPEPLTGNTIVFSAAQGDETAFSYNRKKHSLFTYYLLKKLQEGDGKVSLGELSTYVNKKVRQESVLKLGKTQTPTVNVSDEFSDKWESLTL